MAFHIFKLAPGDDPEHRLRLGMSVAAEIDTRAPEQK